MELAQNIGVYVVSFCFVANCWYKHALMFNEVDEVPHKVIILDFLLLLAVSLIPAFTKLMISDIAQGPVMMCGIAYLIVTVFETILAREILTSKYQDENQMKKVYTYIFGRSYTTSIELLIIFIVIAYFSATAGLVLFIIVPVRSFIANAGKQQNFNDIAQLNSQGVTSFMSLSQSDKRKFLSMLRRYLGQVRRPEISQELKHAAWSDFVNEVQRSFGLSEEQVSQWFHDATVEGRVARDHRIHDNGGARTDDSMENRRTRSGRRNRQERGRRH